MNMSDAWASCAAISKSSKAVQAAGQQLALLEVSADGEHAYLHKTSSLQHGTKPHVLFACECPKCLIYSHDTKTT
jgi:hypothetical protein